MNRPKKKNFKIHYNCKSTTVSKNRGIIDPSTLTCYTDVNFVYVFSEGLMKLSEYKGTLTLSSPVVSL